MEPEEIDKLFKDRLAGLPAVPSADAWQRLQQKMEPPKKERSLWIYYAAASVVILLISGILLMKTNNQNPGLANNTQRDTNIPPMQNQKPFIIKDNKEQTKIAEQTLSKEVNPENNNLGRVSDIPKIIQNGLAANIPKKTEEKLPNKLTKESRNRSGYVAINKETKNRIDSGPEFKVTSNNNSKNTEANAFTLADNTQSASEAALTASIVEVTIKKNYPDEFADDENGLRANLAKKTLLLKNIYKQARNLKNGEPVELTALGVDKEKLQAETKEIKQKLNKVISL